MQANKKTNYCSNLSSVSSLGSQESFTAVFYRYILSLHEILELLALVTNILSCRLIHLWSGLTDA